MDEDEYEDEYDEALFEGIFYHWSCPACLEVNQSENDVRGYVEKCSACGEKSRVSQ